VIANQTKKPASRSILAIRFVITLDELDCLKDNEIVEIPIETEEESAENIKSLV